MATAEFSFPVPTVVVPPAATTLDGFRVWLNSTHFPERGRITFVDGKLIIDMSPERYETHLKIKEAISRVLGKLVRDLDMGDFYPDGGFVTNPSAGISNQPDAMFASWETLESGKLAPPSDQPKDGRHLEMVGSPDWVCEIVSDTSVEKDTKILLEAYHRAGIREYWLVDARGESINFQLLIWTPDRYQQAESRDGWLRSTIFDREFRLTRSIDRLGRWRYDLESR